MDALPLEASTAYRHPSTHPKRTNDPSALNTGLEKIGSQSVCCGRGGVVCRQRRARRGEPPAPVKRSTGHTHTHTHTHTPTENNTPDTDTHTHDKDTGGGGREVPAIP